MARDFTLSAFRNLLQSLSTEGYSFTTVIGYSKQPQTRTVVLRHDVDALPENSVTMAMAEHAAGVRGTYYFRCGPGGFDSAAIRQISDLGHETGYHYEEMAITWRSKKRADREQEIAETAFESFRSNLLKLREISETETICMHGSPASFIDSRMLWKYFDYRELGIAAEPYMDISFEDMLYLTDTGRRWDGSAFSVRDKAGFKREMTDEAFKEWKTEPLTGSLMNMTVKSLAMQSQYRFRSTADIVRGAREGRLPDRIMLTVHPQRWDDRRIPWLKELIQQRSKNMVKYFVVKFHEINKMAN